MNIYNPAQDLEILGASTITSENIRIFDHLLEHVIHVAPHLATAVLDEATWNSARKYFVGCKIVLCAFHATEYMKKRCGGLCRQNVYLSGYSNKASRWIQCQKSEFWKVAKNKW